MKAIGHTAMKLLKGQFTMLRFFWKWYFGEYNDEWYLSLFAGRVGISGDITPTYGLLSEADVDSMKSVIPNVKIIFLLRDPIDRAWSHMRMQAGKDQRRLESYSIEEIKDLIN